MPLSFLRSIISNCTLQFFPQRYLQHTFVSLYRDFYNLQFSLFLCFLFVCFVYFVFFRLSAFGNSLKFREEYKVLQMVHALTIVECITEVHPHLLITVCFLQVIAFYITGAHSYSRSYLSPNTFHNWSTFILNKLTQHVCHFTLRSIPSLVTCLCPF